ncbi:unnamed protein product [Haemonchus placei]|uniref:ShTK domain protein n=1 Tax=Haemonchus placei TaxID=6290 RepID=A0A158QRT5_HAEPC|nr:unnamed protein product [Haemonchus placei]
MLLILTILCVVLIKGVDAQILDLNCTHMVAGVAKYSQSAVNCNNRISDAACLVIYTDAVKADDGTERNAKCAGDPVNPQLVQAAIDICPKTCGYCCLTPAFMCQNKLQPRVPCSSVTEDMCENAYWKPILEEDCPKTCGLCTAGSCVDEAPGCGLDNAFICQSKNLQAFVQYSQSAVNCNNRISDAACLVIYTAAVKAEDNTDRNAKCDGNPNVNPQLVQAAIDICPKTCGYCCLTPAFLCQNKLQPRVPCSSVTQDMCENPAWKTILEEDCPKTCGFCNSGSCIDEAPGCNLGNAIICQSKNLEAFAKKYCKKTCGYCNDGTTTTSPSPFNRVTSVVSVIGNMWLFHFNRHFFQYSQSAVNCNNKISDAACLVIYTEAVKAEDNQDRNEKCAGVPVNPALVQAAIDICPKTCGYCCLTPAFMCENKLQPRVPCSSVTQDMCENPVWRTILEEDCPKTCGFCNSGMLGFLQ